MSRDQQLDISDKEKELIKKRLQLRETLKKEYIKQITNPHRYATGEGGTVVSENSRERLVATQLH